MTMQDPTVAAQILSHLGGSARLSVMIGARFFMSTETSLEFRFAAKNKKGINHVKVELEGTDTYKVEFYKVARLGPKKIDEATGIDASNLVHTVSTTAEVFLTLGTMGR